MDLAMKQAIKDLLHLLVDKEEPAVIQDLLSKLPVQWAGIAQLLLTPALPVALAAQDKAIDAI